jgi:hypothetical protein
MANTLAKAIATAGVSNIKQVKARENATINGGWPVTFAHQLEIQLFNRAASLRRLRL